MKQLFTIAILLCSIGVLAQKPKQHVKYDTVKTIQKRIVYDPDTIPVYFKEVVLGNQIYESWNYGYVVWQSYEAISMHGGFVFGDGGGISFGNDTTYVRNEYQFSPTPAGQFLYMNKKPVTNKVIFVLKR